MKNWIMVLGLLAALFMGPKSWGQEEETLITFEEDSLPKTLTTFEEDSLPKTLTTFEEDSLPKDYITFDLALGAGSSDGNNLYYAAVSMHSGIVMLRNRRLLAGLGFRISAFDAANELLHTTGEPDLIKKNLIDSIRAETPFYMKFSFTFNVAYLITPKLKIGYNADIGSFTIMSKSKIGHFISSDNRGQYAIRQKGYFSQSTHEFFLAYNINEEIGVRAGLNLSRLRFSTEEELTYNNSCFRKRILFSFLGIYYTPA
ncbi:hypothetical protein [Saprospira grandis]|uniref:hypothetical protein n=1 Tax=Saprospira grandis TaxID=1008 RepID=UPI0022DE184C|nr:hypothetical protein [Saprospira grandis]WBM74405.1 hypothetical protein OP864_15575 [Saprospira grandis]